MTEATRVFISQENVNDENVTLVAWCVANGGQVQAGQGLAEVEGSKAVFGIPAPVDETVHTVRHAVFQPTGTALPESEPNASVGHASMGYIVLSTRLHHRHLHKAYV